MFECFLKVCSRKFMFYYTPTRITGTLLKDPCIFMVVSLWIIVGVRNVSDKRCRQNHNTHFMFSTLLSKIVSFKNDVEKYGTAAWARDNTTYCCQVQKNVAKSGFNASGYITKMETADSRCGYCDSYWYPCLKRASSLLEHKHLYTRCVSRYRWHWFLHKLCYSALKQQVIFHSPAQCCSLQIS